MSDEAYQGAYESNTEIKVVINREILEDIVNQEGRRLVWISDDQFSNIVKKAYELGLVSNFIESLVGVVHGEYEASTTLVPEKVWNTVFKCVQ